ncbi:MAG: SelB domain-containing protein, partial [Bellilinea sp.]
SSENKLFVGASEVLGRVRVLGTEQLAPGEEGYLQIELRDPVVAVRGDRYILRRPSPGETLGGGVVLDSDPKGRYKRKDPAVLERLRALTEGTPAEVLLQAALTLGIAPIRDIVRRARLEEDSVKAVLSEVVESGQLLVLENSMANPLSEDLAAHTVVWNTETTRILNEVAAFHKAFPLRGGIPREMLKSRLKLTPRVFQVITREMDKAGTLHETGQLLKLPGFEVKFTPPQRAKVDGLLRQFAMAPYATPGVKECISTLGEDVYSALIDRGDLVAVSADVVYRKSDYQKMLKAVEETIEKTGSLTAGQFRDQFNTSRKYALAFLEHLDAIGVTVRDGDVRILGKNRD